ncbi:ATP-dependent helicase [Candidatus Saccharibacteria bacterium]|nr:ATP-dependent helicase [Candidatus Saccharibacteria bacterium]
MNKEFERAYKKLNDGQRQAVDKIDGPVLVIAGPGTGKTELLALRAANILRKDSTMLPSNILCLTFTDSAAENMRQRLIKYIGQDAYQAAIHTFNSFGQYVINTNPEYFYEWRETKTADELTTHSILEAVLASLPGSHPLAGRSIEGQFFAQTQIKNLIGDAKRADLSPDDLRQVLAVNDQTYKMLLPIFRKLWPPYMGAKGVLSGAKACANKIGTLAPTKSRLEAVVSLQTMITNSLNAAAVESAHLESGQTKPFSAFKQTWFSKDDNNQLIFRGQKYQAKLLAAVDIYEQYEAELKARGCADFNDQIMWVLTAMRNYNNLRYNLQERFQYIMVDEFQDTNRSQLLMAKYLTDAPVHEGRPNILAVGDDDQAIYRFQGADIANVGLFESEYKDPLIVPLTVNYRSNDNILQEARRVADQIRESLAKTKKIDKTLTPIVKQTGVGLQLNDFEDEGQHYTFIARQIKKLLAGGATGREIAVLARERAQLDALLPYLRTLSVPINYERRENVLEQKHIVKLLAMARLVLALTRHELETVNILAAQILSQPMWRLSASEIWRIAAEAYRYNQQWFDIIMSGDDGRAKQIAEFFINLGFSSASLPAEEILDQLIGTKSSSNGFTSPYKDFYFGHELLASQPSQYLTLLSHLKTLRDHLRNYQTDSRRTLYLQDLIDFVNSYQRVGNLTMLDRAPHNEDQNAVQLMTTHKAKGLEFESVFVIGLQNNVWSRSGSRGRFSYPLNLKTIQPTKGEDDDGLRLLYVAMTRAKQNLYLNYFRHDEHGNSSHPHGPLLALAATVSKPKIKRDARSLAVEYEQRWLSTHGSLKDGELKAFLEDQLSRYKLSSTEFNNFLDVSLGGPSYFFTRNLLHFPQAKTPPAIYGDLIHRAISRAHAAVQSGQKVDIKKIIAGFLSNLHGEPLSEADKQAYAQRGSKSLTAYLAKSGDKFTKNQAVDIDFRSQGATVGKAFISGVIDRLDIDQRAKTAVLSEYKTGSVFTKWQAPPKAQEYDKIRRWRYHNQLLFYKLLFDSAADWGKRGWHLEQAGLRFIEPDAYGKIRAVPLLYEESKLREFRKLVMAVWQHIQALDFPDTSPYPPSLKGIQQFEADLIKTTGDR